MDEMVDPRAMTEEAEATWRSLALGWERHADLIRDTSAPVSGWLVDRLDPQPGETVLELGAGPGDTGFEIAGRLGPEGRLICTDIADQMLEVARRRAGPLDLGNITFQVMDAQEIQLPDDSVDGVVHRFGPMLLPDPAASFSDVRRILRDGGRYVAAVWDAPEHNAWLLGVGMSLLQHGIMPSRDPNAPGGGFSLADAERFRSLVEGAGFATVEVEAVPQPLTLRGVDELWAFVMDVMGSMAEALRSVSDEQRTAVKETLSQVIEPYRTPEGLRLPAQALCLYAR